MHLHDISGLFLIVLGFLVRRFPNLIAGYNALPPEKKAEVDIVGLSTTMRNTLIAMGGLTIISNRLLIMLDIQENENLIHATILIGGLAYSMINAQMYVNRASEGQTQSRIRKFGKYLVIVILFLIPCGIIIYGTRTPNYTISEDHLEISGIYGFTVNIKDVRRLESIPTILKRTNGFSMGSTRRGNFDLHGYGQCKLFLESMDSPFIYIEPEEGLPVIINTKSEAKSEELLFELQQQVTK